MLKKKKEDLISGAAFWFGHIYIKVCQLNTFSGAMTKVGKGYVRGHFCLSQGKQ
jgi:hypothetical protein